MKTIFLLIAILFAVNCETYYRELSNPIIEEVNSNPYSTWTAGYNCYFENKTKEEIKHLMGSLEEPSWMKLPEIEMVEAVSIPDSFDARSNWPNCQSIQEVRDQSNCGSCWAFGCVEAVSDRICISSNQQLQTRISAQDLVSCCGFWCGNGCNGGYPSSAWKHFVNTGLVTGDLYQNYSWCQPYDLPPCDHHCSGQYAPCSGEAKTPKCVKQCNQYYNRTYTSDIHKGKTAYTVPQNIAKIQTEIMTNGPVEASFTVYEDFLSYTGGVYNYTSGEAVGGHAVKMLGWGVYNSTPYWLCANSWNQDWGLAGFFMILRGSNECGIESGIVAGLV